MKNTSLQDLEYQLLKQANKIQMLEHELNVINDALEQKCEFAANLEANLQYAIEILEQEPVQFC